MPVKTSTTSLIAVGLASFVAGVLVSRRKCRSCATDSNVKKWGRLYLTVDPPEEFNDTKKLNEEIKKITAQVQKHHVDKLGFAGKYKLGYTYDQIIIEGENILEVQYYTVRILEDGYTRSSFETDSSLQAGEAPRAAPRMMSLEAGTDDTGHTPPQCPRPRPNFKSKYDFEGWQCDYN
ncbi:hypothetical protein [Flavitalea sp.]|nr:hypothetical protein [Flavitalea sp.]